MEYLQCFNATGAAARAGYKGSRAVLASMGSENLRKPKIREKIDAILEEKAMTAKEVVFRLSRQARGSMADFLERGEDGRYQSPRVNQLLRGFYRVRVL